MLEVFTHEKTSRIKSLPYNSQRFNPSANLYDKYRPQPPATLLDVLTRLARSVHGPMVIDMGCGTGLSTRLWSERADRVVGIEPADNMREQAEIQTSEQNVSYINALSHKTGLPDDCADIVTCSQSLHWMQPYATFAEAARILRPGGVFAAYDHVWPPKTWHREVDQVYCNLMLRVRWLENRYQTSDGLKIWSREQHLLRMRLSGHFRYTKELHLCHVERGNAERFIGLIKSKGGVAALLKVGLTEREIGLENLRGVVADVLGDNLKPWYFRYNIRIGVV